MNLKIRAKLFISFITLCFFSFLFTVVSNWIYDKKNKISEQLNLLDQIHLLTLEEYKLQQEFLLYETINPKFFKTGKSKKIDEHQIIYSQIVDKLNLLNNNEESKELFDKNFVNTILLESNEYQNIFKKVVAETQVRGFKDFGEEGEMRTYAHALMDIKDIDQVNILMLRRHEKDFIIRKEDEYINKFKKLIELVKEEINQNYKLSLVQKIKLDSIVNGYSTAFIKLAVSEQTLLGKKTGSGLIFQLADQHNLMIAHINQQKRNAVLAEKKIQENLFWISISSMIFLFVLAFLLSYRLASQLSRPVSNLNKHITKYVDSKFTITPEIIKRNSTDEISELSNNFSKMVEEITSHIKHFEEKVEKRTKEVNKKNEEILTQKVKIDIQYEQLIVKTKAIESQQKLVLEKNKNIMDSIRYAERIQKAIMPSKIILEKILPQSFIYFQPCDIVSGDFYFLHQKKNKIFFSIADCTGHGVPGAFLSIIGTHAIHRALNEFNLEEPAEILNKVNFLVEQSISNYDESILNDGMDIAFCCLDTENLILEYSGANIPLWIVSEYVTEDNYIDSDVEVMIKSRAANNTHTLREIKADSQPIGNFHKRIPFSNIIIELQPGDSIYIFSDGYADQFGGPKGKKFKYNRLENLLLNIQKHSMDKQKQVLKETILGWKGKTEQTDDICVFGVKV